MVASDESQPFALPLAVTNNSTIFSANYMLVYCVGDVTFKGEDPTKAGIQNSGGIEPKTGPLMLAPRETKNVPCALGDEIVWPVTRIVDTAQFRVGLQYQTCMTLFGYEMCSGVRQTIPRLFTWYTKGSRPFWLEGEIAR